MKKNSISVLEKTIRKLNGVTYAFYTLSASNNYTESESDMFCCLAELLEQAQIDLQGLLKDMTEANESPAE